MKHYGFGIVARCSKFKREAKMEDGRVLFGRPRNGRYTKRIAAIMKRGHKAERQQVRLYLLMVRRGS